MTNAIKGLAGRIVGTWQILPDGVKRVIHAFWETFIAVFIAGIGGVFSASDKKSAIVALVAAAMAAALSAAKALVIAKRA